MPQPECDFCGTKQEGPYQVHCTECGYPVYGTPQEQQLFTEQHQQLKEVLDKAEGALSSARFALLWPWLAALLFTCLGYWTHRLGTSGIIVGTALPGIFIASYFLTPLKPVPILLIDSIVMLLIIGMTFYTIKDFSLGGMIGVVLPILIGSMYVRALFLCRKAENALEKKKHSALPL